VLILYNARQLLRSGHRTTDSSDDNSVLLLFTSFLITLHFNTMPSPGACLLVTCALLLLRVQTTLGRENGEHGLQGMEATGNHQLSTIDNDIQSRDRLAGNLGLVDSSGNPVPLTQDEAIDFESQIAVIRQEQLSTGDTAETRNFGAIAAIKMMYYLIQVIREKLGMHDSNNVSPCESSPCTNNGTQPYCSPIDGSCVSCLSDQTCLNPSFPFCSSNSCRQCTSSADCAGNQAKQICDTKGEQICLECVTNDDCKASGNANQFCGDANTCVQCLEDRDCFPEYTGEYPCPRNDTSCPALFCSTDNVCVPCTTSRDCEFCPPLRVCGEVNSLVGNETNARSGRGSRSRSGHHRGRNLLFHNIAIPTACLQCAGDIDCIKFNGSRPYCDENRCAQCTVDKPCPNESPYCVDGSCKKCPDGSDSCAQERNCISDAQCPESLVPFCGGQLNNSCVECTKDEHCSLPNPVCGGDNTCTQCVNDSQCGPPNPYCSSNGRCSGCLNDSNCQSPLPKCSVSDGLCVQCLSATDCEGTGLPDCDPSTLRCVEVRPVFSIYHHQQ